MTDCSAGGRRVAATQGESATFNEQNASPTNNNAFIIGLSVGVVVLVVVVVVIVIIVVARSKQTKEESV
jgi:heme/copper-type cytochrome/quinol oxidase subunit 2